MKLRHVGILVTDIPRAIEFYENLGFKKISSKKESNHKIRQALDFMIEDVEWVKLKSKNDTLLELLKFTTSYSIAPSLTLQHMALTVNNLDKLYEKMREKMEFLSKPILKGNVKLVFCRDYDGNLIELVEEL